MRRAFLFVLGLLVAMPALAFNGRVINLGDATVTAAVTDQVITSSTSAQSATIAYIDRLEGMNALTFEARFVYGSGGTSVKADLYTSIDQGANWIPICRLAFTTASALKVANVSGLTPKTTAVALSTPSDDSCVDGVLGDRLLVKITTVGTYAGSTTISARAAVR
jgi:hypothetical protein